MLIYHCFALIQEAPARPDKISDWLLVLCTLSLTAVTGWLAWETKKIGRDSVKASQASIEASRAAQETATASVKSAKLAEDSVQRTSHDLQATALLNLYATYTSEHYTVARKNAWDLILLSIRCKTYFDFLVSTHFATEYIPSGIPEQTAKELWECGRAMLPENFDNFESFKTWEANARHDLEDMMHFYVLVNHRIKHSEGRYEFYYDWWRPFFWWMADEMESFYTRMPNDRRQYVSEPKWKEHWESLDAIYEFVSPKTASERFESLKSHPTVISILDTRHTYPSEPTKGHIAPSS